MSKATDLIESIRAEGHDDKAIADALCDGAYLGTLGDEYTQEDVEEAYGLMTTSMAAKALGRV